MSGYEQIFLDAENNGTVVLINVPDVVVTLFRSDVIGEFSVAGDDEIYVQAPFWLMVRNYVGEVVHPIFEAADIKKVDIYPTVDFDCPAGMM